MSAELLKKSMGVVSLESFKAIWQPVFKFFASLKLAIFVLLSLMGVLAAGTILESLHGTDAARILVYDSVWFSILLFLLGVNVASAALDRLPWKKKHIGFVITHLGIIIILVGSFVTKRFMIDGQMVLAEGETEHRLMLPDPILYAFSQKSQKDVLLPIPKQAFAWQGAEALQLVGGPTNWPYQLSLRAFFPKAIIENVTQAAETGPAALELHIQNSFMQQTFWLVENDPSQGTIPMGPATFRFTDELIQVREAVDTKQVYLEFDFGKDKKHLPLPNDLKLPAKLSLKGTPYQIQVLHVFRNAAVEGKTLVEQKSKAEGPGENPAVQFLLMGQDWEERHTSFANFPDFPTQHGMQPSKSGAKIYFRLPGAGSRGESHELRFVYSASKPGESKKLVYQIQEGMEIQNGEVELGKEVPTGWMDLKFQVKQFYPHSRTELNAKPVSNISQRKDVIPALQLEIKKNQQSQLVWLKQGQPERVFFNDDEIQVLFGEKRIPAGFKLSLRDFRIQNNPGSNSPASFESDVTLKDDSRGLVKEVTISMNHPLEYRGFKIYQSGYSVEPGQPEISIFSVGRDPGVPIKYLGTIVMVIGIIIMFYFRKLLAKAENR